MIKAIKKITIIICLFFSLLPISAFAEEMVVHQPGSSLESPLDKRYYLGLNYLKSKASYNPATSSIIVNGLGLWDSDSYAKNFAGGEVYGGIKLNKFSALELSYSASFSTSSNSSNQHDSRFQTLGLDAVFNLPIKKLNLLGIIGFSDVIYPSEKASVSEYTSHGTTFTANTTSNDSSLALDLGLGLEYNLDNNFAFRTIYKKAYIFTGNATSIESIGVGIKYRFGSIVK